MTAPDDDPATELAHLRRERDDLSRALELAEAVRKGAETAGSAVLVISYLEGRYAFVNQAMADFIGVTVAEIMASDPYEFWQRTTHPDDMPRERAALDPLLAGTVDRISIEKRWLRPNGDVRWGRATSRCVRGADGRIDYLVGSIDDLHEQKTSRQAREALEAQLLEAHKLEALGRLAGGVAHEFNNRLAIIMGYADLLRGRLPEGDMQAQAGYVLESAQFAGQLTQQLLAFSRRQVLDPEAFDLDAALGRSGPVIQKVVGSDIVLDVRPGARWPVFCDRGQVEQVLLNLALNARDAMPGAGRLVLETRDVTPGPGSIPAVPAGDYVKLAVTDTGCGIPEADLPRVFEPFFTTKPVGRGTGLGLATVAGIVRQSGGAITVSSEVGRGTTFRVLLPRSATPVAARPAPPVVPEPEPRSHEVVLVCDDDAPVRQLVAEIMRLGGFQVIEAADVAQAREAGLAARDRLSLLVTDVVIGDGDGRDLAKALRADRPDLRVLYVSGYSEEAIRIDRATDATTDFLAKPFLPGALLGKARRLLSRRADGRSAVR